MTDRLFKLTNEFGRTRGRTQWGPGVTHTATGEDRTLCTDGVIHAYTGLALALMLNPIHCNFPTPKLWSATGDVIARDNDVKVGCRSLTTVEELVAPSITTEKRVLFSILCAKEVYKDDKFNAWADNWISGKDRSASAARSAAESAAESAAWSARSAAESAAWSAWSAAESAAWSARSAAWSARSAAPFSLVDIAETALRSTVN